MKHQLFALILGITMAATSQAGSFRSDQQHQRQRINQGLRSGELTNREAARLYGREALLNREYLRERRDGRGLTWAEHRRLEARQNSLGRSIYREKHDRQYR